MRKLLRLVLSLIIASFSIAVVAQPANDNCANASVITIGSGGFALGSFTGSQFDIGTATLQAGETFAPGIVTAGLTKKSIWYKFSIPTTRTVEVFLKQPAVAIQDGDVGFAVYKANSCLPGDAQIASTFTPISKFAASKHECVPAGDYYVQVSANNNASGPIFISLDIKDPNPIPYDKPATASKFGKVGSNKTTGVEFRVECQSIEDANEVCLANTSFKDYTKSTWHTFTTPDYFDFIALMISGNTSNYWDQTKFKIGFRLFEGDVTTTPLASLAPVGGCDSLWYNTYAADFRLYKCGMMKSNTTYSVQLLYHTDFKNDVRFAVHSSGTAPTRAPEPIAGIPAASKLGVLPSGFGGITTTATPDRFACNARHVNYNCPKTLPTTGWLVPGNNVPFTLSTFYSFTLANTAQLNIYAAGGGWGTYVRLYKQTLGASCTSLDTANIVATGTGNIVAECMPPGDYVVQIMGSDSAYCHAYGFCPGSSQLVSGDAFLPFYRNLGGEVSLSIRVETQVGINKYSLNAPGAVEKINTNAGGIMQPLQPYKTYTTTPDSLGCANTVLPVDNCGVGDQKASYREFVTADSGFLAIQSVFNYVRLYKGDANALAVAQNKFAYPATITGLEPITPCIVWNWQPPSAGACIAPGTYSLVGFGPLRGGFNNSIIVQQPSFTLSAPKPKHPTPQSAQDMGDLWAQLGPAGGLTASDIDTFTCYDNPATIDGLDGCAWGPHKGTKLIYRQFYLSQPSSIRIATGISGYTYYNGYLTLFSGKATDGIAGLKKVGDDWKCFGDKSLQGGCNQLPAGWYTVVSYGHGQSFENQTTNNMAKDGYTTIGRANAFYVQLFPQTCARPQFNRPYKASVDTITKKPYVTDWAPRAGHTTAYPATWQKYTLNKENFDCTEDTAFIRQHMGVCKNAKVAFYVFQITKESYVKIGSLPADASVWSSVYAFDVRSVDSVKLKTDAPLQACINQQDVIELCKLQPGYYTLVVLVPGNYTCHSIQPTVYVDQVAFSRFDHASNAYDFGTLKPDSAWYKGKIGDVNPLNSSRAPSNDFFYCTTGAQKSDPNDADYYLFHNPNIYPATDNKVSHPDYTSTPHPYYGIDRRNLWYTFTVNQPGLVRVKMNLPTPGKSSFGAYVVYKSDVDGTLPFTSVVSQGLVDSTLGQGLVRVTQNFTSYPYPPYTTEEAAFFVNPCNFKPTRYYILVEVANSASLGDRDLMRPNYQVEMSVLLSSIAFAPTKFDHYSQAHDLGLVNSGKKKGAVDNFTCATRDLPDPLMYLTTQCQKTLWYKFTTTVTGTIRYSTFFKNQYNYYYDHIQLFRQVKPNDSSSNGLLHLPHTGSFSDANNQTWAVQCISPGTYYILLPGCNAANEDVYPEIEIIPQAGDFCSNPLVATLNGVNSKTATVKVDCHTIGTDYGEFNQTLTCPDKAITAEYKTSWYRLDITGTDTLDVKVYINEKTNADPTVIKYRMMTGNCGAMQAQSCVQDARTENTYECMAPNNSYFIQVFTPISYQGAAVTGDIDLIISSVKHVTTCAPANNCIAVAEFTPQFDCTKDRNVKVTNLSTYGSDIKYLWNFGYNNQTSSASSPEFFYPALTTDKTYTITLEVTNTLCGKKDVISKPITIPARPTVSLGSDTVICVGPASVPLDATSHTGTTYQWYTWVGYWNPFSTNPKINVTNQSSLIVELTYNNCKARDTVNIWINPIVKKALQTQVLCKVDKINLSAHRGYGEQYSWSTGSVANNIDAFVPGYYWCDVYLNGCTIRDSFLVINPTVSQQKRMVAVCQKAMPYTYDASVSGASSYTWNDNSTNAQKTIPLPGLYWVDINLSGCTYRDTLTLVVDSFRTNTVSARICGGQSYKLPSGKTLTTSGVFRDSLKNSRGCDSIITTLTLKVDTVARKNFSTSVCSGQFYTLPSGRSINTAGAYVDTVRYTSGCDSIITNLNLLVATPVRNSVKDTICSGKSYLMPSGKTVNSSGTYSDTLRAKAGCDSVINTIQLTVLSPVVNTIITSVCFGKTFTLPSGRVVSTNGLHRDTIRYSNGCDSLISNITLSVGSPVRENKPIIICQGQTYTLPSGRIITITGNYNDTARSVGGCDSLISVISLTVQSATDNAVSDFICGGKTYTLPSGKTVNSTGAYLDTLRYKSGCDSIRYNINLKVFDVIINNQSVSICAGKTYTLPSGKIVSTTAVFKDTIRYTNGCDSLLSTISLTVGQPVRETKSTIICLGQSFKLPSGRIVSAAGNYIDTARTTGGCDSLISTVSLQVDVPQQRSISTTICSNDVYTSPGGKQWNVAGTYKDTLHNIRGCDSLQFTIDLKIENVSRTKTDTIICSGITYKLPSGKLVTTAGTYIDTLRSKLGCDSIITTNLQVLPKLIVAISGINNICEGFGTSLTATASGGNGGPYTISWSNNAGNGNIINVSPATTTRYVATVNDGCTKPAAIDSVTVQVTPKPNASITASKSSGCEALQIQFSHGNNILNRHWNFGTGLPADTSNNSTPTFIYTKAGSYTASLRVTTPEGCTNTSNTTIVVYPTPQSDFTQPNPICAGNAITVNGAVNNATGISWSWNFGNGQTSNLQNPAPQKFTAAGNYQIDLVVKNAAGCSDTTSRRLVVQPIPVPGLAHAQLKICLGSSTALQAKDGTSYSWSPTTGLSNTGIPNPTATPVTDTRYKVTVTNTAGCSATDSVMIKVTQPFTLSASSDTLVCLGKSVTLTANGAVRYSWTGAGSNQSGNSVTVKPNNTTTFSVTGYGVDSCFTQSKSITVTVIPLPTVNAGNDTTVMVGSSFTLLPTYSTDVTEWRWTPGQFLNCDDCHSPVTTPRSEIKYLLTVRNRYQCEASDSRSIKLLCNTESVFLPNTFTPNGDGMNDVWYPRGNGIQSIRYLKVFNRWGQVIFERSNFNSDDRAAGWDGMFKGQLLAPDVFVYSLGMICDNGQLVESKGNVMIVR